MTSSDNEALEQFITSEFLYDRQDVELDEELSLIESGVIDSLGIFQLVEFIEDQYGVDVKPQDVVVDNFETIRAINSLIDRRSTDD